MLQSFEFTLSNSCALISRVSLHPLIFRQAPAIAALAGVAANRKVMSSFGAVEVLVGLIEDGKSVKVKLEAWEAILQLLQSSDACQRFLERKGLQIVLGLARDRNSRIRHKAVQVLSRCLAKDLLKITERISPVYVDGLCSFLLDTNAATSEAAGATLLALVRASIAEGLVWSVDLVGRLAQALCGVKAVLDNHPYAVRNKGHAHVLVRHSASVRARDMGRGGWGIRPPASPPA